MLPNKYKYLILFGALLVLAPIAVGQNRLGNCTVPMKYENNNQVDPKSLRLDEASGQLIDIDSIAIPGGCVGVFRESDHKLVKMIEIRDNGKFGITGLPKGNYRLVVQAAGFCAANSKLVVGRNVGRKTIVVHMRPSGIDSCSFLTYK